MAFPFASARKMNVRGIASHFALALALASGAVAASAAIAPAAYAQQNSRGFARVYQPIADLTAGEMPNWPAAAAQFNAITGAIENEDDRFVAGNFALQIGINTTDKAFQRRGLEMMIQSGKVAPERLGQYNQFVASLAFEAGDFPASRAAFQAALDAGHAGDDPRGAILQTFFAEDRFADGLAYLESLIAGGTPLNDDWFLVALQDTYNNDLQAETNRSAALLMTHFPSKDNWIKSLQRVASINQFDEQGELDLLRLERLTDAITQRVEYTHYIANADPRIMAGEVLPVLAEAVAAGLITEGEEYHGAVVREAAGRVDIDRRELPTTLRLGDNGTAADALDAGNVLYALGDYARAEVYFRKAVDKGGDRDLALTRAGIAQVMQGNFAGAQETFVQVGGARAPLAAMWAIYAGHQAAN